MPRKMSRHQPKTIKYAVARFDPVMYVESIEKICTQVHDNGEKY